MFELAALFASPGYDAWTVALPAPVPVTVVEHVPPAERAQVAGANVTLPVPPVCDQVIVSPVIEPVKPATVAVHVVVERLVKVDGAQETVVVVKAFTVRGSHGLVAALLLASPL